MAQAASAHATLGAVVKKLRPRQVIGAAREYDCRPDTDGLIVLKYRFRWSQVPEGTAAQDLAEAAQKILSGLPWSVGPRLVSVAPIATRELEVLLKWDAKELKSQAQTS